MQMIMMNSNEHIHDVEFHKNTWRQQILIDKKRNEGTDCLDDTLISSFLC